MCTLFLFPTLAQASTSGDEGWSGYLVGKQSTQQSSEVSYSPIDGGLPFNKHPLFKTFYFMRHGETDWNKKNIYMGTQDIPINNDGIRQAEEAVELIESADIDIDYIVTGPLSRAVSTANIVANRLCKQLIVMDEFKQCCWGSIEGGAFDGGTMIERWLLGETPNGAEEAREFDARVLRGLTTALDLQGNVLIISHGGVYRSIRRIMGLAAININHCTPYYNTPPVCIGQPWISNKIEDSRRMDEYETDYYFSMEITEIVDNSEKNKFSL